jgi:hypothetical protein
VPFPLALAVRLLHRLIEPGYLIDAEAAEVDDPGEAEYRHRKPAPRLADLGKP